MLTLKRRNLDSKKTKKSNGLPILDERNTWTSWWSRLRGIFIQKSNLCCLTKTLKRFLSVFSCLLWIQFSLWLTLQQIHALTILDGWITQLSDHSSQAQIEPEEIQQVNIKFKQRNKNKNKKTKKTKTKTK